MKELNERMNKHFTLTCFAALCGLVIFLSFSSAESRYKAYDIDNQESLGYVVVDN